MVFDSGIWKCNFHALLFWVWLCYKYLKNAEQKCVEQAEGKLIFECNWWID